MKPTVRHALDRMKAQDLANPELLRTTGSPQEPIWQASSKDPERATVRQRRRTTTWKRWVAVAGAVLAVGAFILVPRFNEPAAYAATAPMLSYEPASADVSARTLLADLSARTRKQPSPPGTGPYHYVHTRGWNLSMSVTTDMELLDSRIQENEREQWGMSDGSGRLEIVKDDAPGESVSQTSGPSPTGWPKFVTESDINNAENPDRPASRWFDFASEMWSRQVVTPAMQSALLDVLAAKPDIVVEGSTTDRAGRTAIAISTQDRTEHAQTPNERYTMLLDPDSGMLLGYEQVAVEPGDLPIRTPATISYKVWMDSGYTTNVNTRP